MVYLKIENGRGFFYGSDKQYKPIDQINKQDLLFLLNQATCKEIEFEMSDYTAESIQNEAHRIIYFHIFKKFQELVANKSRFIDESEELYKEAFRKYSQ